MPPPATPSPHRFLATRDRKPAAQPHHPPSSLRRAFDGSAVQGTARDSAQGSARNSAQNPRDEATPSRAPHAQTSGGAVNGTPLRPGQFKQTPRFAITTPQRATQIPGFQTQRRGEGLHTPAPADVVAGSGTQSNREYGSALRGVGRKLSRVESIDDASQETMDGENEEAEEEDDDEVMLLDNEGSWNVVRSVEGGDVAHPDQDLGSTGGDEHARKRRRLTPRPDTEMISSIEELQERGNGGVQAGTTGNQGTMPPPTTTDLQASLHEPPLSPRPTRAPPFVLSSASTIPHLGLPPTQSHTATPRARNPFILPPSSARMAPGINDPGGWNASAEPTNPLPEHFSPHRRNQKFLPGGMADTVRGWILNVGQSNGMVGYAAADQTFRRNTAIRVRVDRVIAADGALRWVCGRSVDALTGNGDDGAEGEDVRVMLLGQGRDGRDVREGEGVAIAPPSWDVEVGADGERWRVAVDWKML